MILHDLMICVIAIAAVSILHTSVIFHLDQTQLLYTLQHDIVVSACILYLRSFFWTAKKHLLLLLLSEMSLTLSFLSW